MATRSDQRTILTIDLEPELGQRIEAAATARNLSVSDYMNALVQEALASNEDEGLHPLESEKIEVAPLTPEEQERGLQAVAGLTRIRQALFAKHGKLEPESWELLHESREERTRELMRALEE